MHESSLTVTSHESEIGRWEMVAREPSSTLRGLTAGYVGYVEHSPGPFRRRETPGSRVVMILSLGPRLQVGRAATGRAGQTYGSFVAGLHDGAVVTEHDGEQLGIQIDLTPLAARMLLELPLGELANAVVELEDILGATARALIARLHAEESWAGRFAVLDRFLARRISEAPPVASGVARAVGLLVGSGGRESIRAVAADIGWSRPHLTARFQEEIGLTPKAFARILRFERARSLILTSNGADLARIALTCGYSDQPHMNRDFREFSGSSPRDLLTRRLPAGGGISADLSFVQDTSAVAA